MSSTCFGISHRVTGEAHNGAVLPYSSMVGPPVSALAETGARPIKPLKACLEGSMEAAQKIEILCDRSPAQHNAVPGSSRLSATGSGYGRSQFVTCTTGLVGISGFIVPMAPRSIMFFLARAYSGKRAQNY